MHVLIVGDNSNRYRIQSTLSDTSASSTDIIIVDQDDTTGNHISNHAHCVLTYRAMSYCDWKFEDIINCDDIECFIEAQNRFESLQNVKIKTMSKKQFKIPVTNKIRNSTKQRLNFNRKGRV